MQTKINEEILRFIDIAHAKKRCHIPLEHAFHDVFEGALLGIESGIEGYSEWMGADQDRCTLRARTTECVLTWGWLTTGSAEDFVRNTAALEGRFKIVELSHAAMVNFFRSLPEKDQKKVYRYINDHREEPFWQELLKSSHSKWHQIFYGFRSSFEIEKRITKRVNTPLYSLDLKDVDADAFYHDQVRSECRFSVSTMGVRRYR